MRIGFDVDGCLADFSSSFIPQVVKTTGRDLFPLRPFDIPCWHYPEHYGYTRKETSAAWEAVKASTTFWRQLSAYPETPDVMSRIIRLPKQGHEVYFITARVGQQVKAQTEGWLREFICCPTVLISDEKKMCARALRLDYYLDDRLENAEDVASWSLSYAEDGFRPCRTFLLDRPWNTNPDVANPARYVRIHRIHSIHEMLDEIRSVE